MLACHHLPQDADSFRRPRAELRGQVRVAGRGLVQLGGPLVCGKQSRPGDVCSMSATGDQDASRLKFPVGPSDGTGRELEVGGELPDGRQAASRRQHAACGHRRYLRPDLLIWRKRGFEVHREDHRAAPTTRPYRGS